MKEIIEKLYLENSTESGEKLLINLSKNDLLKICKLLDIPSIGNKEKIRTKILYRTIRFRLISDVINPKD